LKKIKRAEQQQKAIVRISRIQRVSRLCRVRVCARVKKSQTKMGGVCEFYLSSSQMCVCVCVCVLFYSSLAAGGASVVVVVGHNIFPRI